MELKRLHAQLEGGLNTRVPRHQVLEGHDFEEGQRSQDMSLAQQLKSYTEGKKEEHVQESKDLG